MNVGCGSFPTVWPFVVQPFNLQLVPKLMMYFFNTICRLFQVLLLFHFTFDLGSLLCSIIVNSLDWSEIRPNLPWLVDSGGCMLLDIFVSFLCHYYICFFECSIPV